MERKEKKEERKKQEGKQEGKLGEEGKAGKLSPSADCAEASLAKKCIQRLSSTFLLG
jgi:hypothetical protein